jgi:hypothetical protein
MRTLALTLIVAALVSPGSSVAAIGYLAPREDAPVNHEGSQETPSDVETSGDWRRSVPASEATDRGHRSPIGSSL